MSTIEEAIRVTVAETLAEMIPAHVTIQPEYLNTEQAADYLSVHPQTLKNMRVKGEGPPFRKLANAVRYKRAELDAWMDAHRHGGGK